MVCFIALSGTQVAAVPIPSVLKLELAMVLSFTSGVGHNHNVAFAPALLNEGNS